jgi:glutamate dehydrogenase/leucine dehydrogenase
VALQKIIHITPPRISAAHIKEKITCIRAHRERIFEVSTQVLHDKLICHNYGQGGAGWTYLFGCVNESMRQFDQQLQHTTAFKNKQISVIGSGCYGLLTAIMLARKGHSVRIVAKEINDVTSYKAAGFFSHDLAKVLLHKSGHYLPL